MATAADGAAEKAVARARERAGDKVRTDSALSWRIVERPGATIVELTGDIDENTDFTELKRRLKGAVSFELSGVRRINSFGVREWIDFIRQLPGVTDMTLVSCSPAFVVQMNMISNFRGPARVRSILAPYICRDCGEEHDELIELPEPEPATARPRARTQPGDTCPPRPCPSCGATTNLDEQPERYLAFLLDP